MTEVQGHAEETAFKTLGPWKDLTVDIVIPFYNEALNLERTHAIHKQLERIFYIKNYLYVNNGSSDKTAENLAALAARDAKVKIITVETNQGYGYGMQQGIKASSADYIMTNHADVQFNSYTYFLTHLAYLQGLPEARAVFPLRANRPHVDAFVSWALRMIVRIFTTKSVADFNGQPKLMPRERIQEGAETLPHNFCLDLALFLKFKPEEVLLLPVLQSARLHGVSSWNRSPFARVKQLTPWFKYIWSISVFKQK